MTHPVSSGNHPRRIADYALIGDCETAALVHRDGSIEWLCWPRFDSEACFASLLGSDDNGSWRIASADTATTELTRRYRGDSLILETHLETPTGSATVLDFMPVRGEASDVVRIVSGERGTVHLRSDLRVCFDYGRLRPRWTQESGERMVAMVGPHAVRLTADVSLSNTESGSCVAEFAVSGGQRVAFVLTYFTSYDREPAVVDAALALEETERFWARWISRCTYEGPWRAAVTRSLLTMKALTYRPSGGIAAAPTSSLPERLGGARNWDYRFCWLRDATFTLRAFLNSGYREEAVAWRDWLLRAVGDEPERLQPVYGLGGEARLPEWTAKWLPGFGGARPVRFGNAAFAQHQFDVYGEVVDALYQSHRSGIELSPAAWRLQVRMIEHLEACWEQPDNGIWESRHAPRRFTHSRAMIWAALDRMIRRSQEEHLEAPLERWKTLRATIHTDICHRGFNHELNSFVRDFDSSELDGSLLRLPHIGFLPPDDPRIRGTVAAIGQKLLRDGFILRYDTHATTDGLPPGEAAFLVCSFWYADALAMIGRRAQAQEMFERLLSVRNDLGLLSEEYDPDNGQLTGNFPQALSHLALVNTALTLQGTPHAQE